MRCASFVVVVVFYMLCDPEEPNQTPACLLSRIDEMLIMMRAGPGFNQISRLGLFIGITL